MCGYIFHPQFSATLGPDPIRSTSLRSGIQRKVAKKIFLDPSRRSNFWSVADPLVIFSASPRLGALALRSGIQPRTQELEQNGPLVYSCYSRLWAFICGCYPFGRIEQVVSSTSTSHRTCNERFVHSGWERRRELLLRIFLLADHIGAETGAFPRPS